MEVAEEVKCKPEQSRRHFFYFLIVVLRL